MREPPGGRAGKADIRRAGAETTHALAEARLRAFWKMEGEKACDRCGQPLTPDHFAREAAHLRADRDAARGLARAADRDAREADALASDAEAMRAGAEADLRKAEDALKDARRDLEQSGSDAAGAAIGCAAVIDGLDDPFRLAIGPGAGADWLATTFPTPADLDEGRRLRDGLAEADRLLREARSRSDASREIRARSAEATRAFEGVGLEPGDEEAEAEHAELAAGLRGHRPSPRRPPRPRGRRPKRRADDSPSTLRSWRDGSPPSIAT